MFKPVYTITETILRNLTTIASSVVTVENAPLIPKWEVSIRREALLRNAHASTAIEGNPLTFDQVSQLAAGRNIMVQRKAKAEVLNYLKILQDIPRLALDVITVNTICKIHRELMQDVLDDPDECGTYRSVQVVVGNRLTGVISFRPPSSREIPELMANFIAWLNDPEADRNPVLEAGISHYEFVRIHPFVDGNGRTARTLASLVLYRRGFDTKRFFALDDYYDSDRQGYYRALQSVHPDTIDLTYWLEYFTYGVMVQIEQVRQRIIGLSLDVQKMKDYGQMALTERQMKIVESVNKNRKITVGEIVAMFGISRQSALKEAGKLMDMNVITLVGKGRGAHYIRK
jgi:Fic family protein